MIKVRSSDPFEAILQDIPINWIKFWFCYSGQEEIYDELDRGTRLISIESQPKKIVVVVVVAIVVVVVHVVVVVVPVVDTRNIKVSVNNFWPQ